MQTLPFDCSHDDIRRLVVEWWELLAAGKYREALEMFDHDDWEVKWSPEKLEEAIATYGCFEPYPGDPKWEAGSIFDQPNPQKIIAAIDVDRENPYGKHPPEYNGMVHFHDVPLKQRVSDMSARFYIKRVGRDQITLEFLDVHVM